MEMGFKIVVDHDKCGNPLECSLCLKSCHRGVLQLIPLGEFKRFEPMPQPDYIVEYFWPEFCDACKACIEACPKSALQAVEE
ncbi:MAG: 4Fe-4S dicluster domain-containing protein [Candidatus Freyrarchaeum guaymaensis]